MYVILNGTHPSQTRQYFDMTSAWQLLRIVYQIRFCFSTFASSTENYLSHISGIESCVALQHLSLAHNNIKKIQNIENLSLKYLNLVRVSLQISELIITNWLVAVLDCLFNVESLVVPQWSLAANF